MFLTWNFMLIYLAFKKPDVDTDNLFGYPEN
jgi:hypothetical protein